MLHKRNRFHGAAALRWVYRGGQQTRGRHMAVRAKAQQQPESRVAIVVSKKVSKSAVVRNRIRRRLYEVIRTKLLAPNKALAVVLTVYDQAVETMPNDELTQEVSGLLSKARRASQQTAPRAIVEREGN